MHHSWDFKKSDICPLPEMIPLSLWNHLIVGNVEFWWASQGEDLQAVLHYLLDQRGPSSERMVEVAASLNGHFAFVARGPGFFFAAVDKIRSIPLFFYSSPSPTVVGNCAHTIRSRYGLSELDEEAIRDVLMAGYSTGMKTVIRDLYQLRPGELLSWTSKEGIRLHRYFFYLPCPEEREDERSFQEELADVTDAVFKWTVETAGGRPILVPLSGGYDSRFILCKLHEMGYQNLYAYSYGLPGNHEARIAQKVACRLGVLWKFVTVDAKRCRRFFESPRRCEYWHMSDGLSSIPVLQDVAQLKSSMERGEIPKNAVVINGQSGDYLTGGHVPQNLLSPEAGDADLVTAIIDKHFSLWTDQKTAETLEGIKTSLNNFFDECRGMRDDKSSPAALFEAWEWQERQCKYVVNGARMYDYAGLSWLMPLWHGRYMDFWEKVPFHLKLEQRLYKQYLTDWNYAGLFRDFSPTVWRWPGITIVILPLAWMLGKIAGVGAKEWFYRRARYFGHYGFAYGVHGWKHFLQRADTLRNPVSLMAETWVNELKNEIAVDI